MKLHCVPTPNEDVIKFSELFGFTIVREKVDNERHLILHRNVVPPVSVIYSMYKFPDYRFKTFENFDTIVEYYVPDDDVSFSMTSHPYIKDSLPVINYQTLSLVFNAFSELPNSDEDDNVWEIFNDELIELNHEEYEDSEEHYMSDDNFLYDVIYPIITVGCKRSQDYPEWVYKHGDRYIINYETLDKNVISTYKSSGRNVFCVAEEYQVKTGKEIYLYSHDSRETSKYIKSFKLDLSSLFKHEQQRLNIVMRKPYNSLEVSRSDSHLKYIIDDDRLYSDRQTETTVIVTGDLSVIENIDPEYGLIYVGPESKHDDFLNMTSNRSSFSVSWEYDDRYILTRVSSIIKTNPFNSEIIMYVNGDEVPDDVNYSSFNCIPRKTKLIQDDHNDSYGLIVTNQFIWDELWDLVLDELSSTYLTGKDISDIIRCCTSQPRHVDNLFHHEVGYPRTQEIVIPSSVYE